MKRYRVKLNAKHYAQPDQIKDGYLAGFGVIQTYTRGEALKKARMFEGKIELVKLSTVLAPLSMVAIPENALLDGVVKLLKGREAFDDATRVSEKIYHGGIFEEISSELAEYPNDEQVPKKVLDQLDELAEMIESDYIMVTQS